jgi:hypothetical protein
LGLGLLFVLLSAVLNVGLVLVIDFFFFLVLRRVVEEILGLSLRSRSLDEVGLRLNRLGFLVVDLSLNFVNLCVLVLLKNLRADGIV